MKTWLFEGYRHIGVQEGVCGNRPTIIGRRLEPKQIVKLSVEEAIEEFDLTMEEVEECYWFMTR